jgi:hypothetical protein
MKITELQQTAALPHIRQQRRAKRLPPTAHLIGPERRTSDPARRDNRRAHTALLIVLVALAIASVTYAIVHESAAALIFAAFIALPIRIAATAARRAHGRAEGLLARRTAPRSGATAARSTPTLFATRHPLDRP